MRSTGAITFVAGRGRSSSPAASAASTARLMQSGAYGGEMTETWKPVVGFEGLYEVSDRGRVRSVDRAITQQSRWGGVFTRRYPGRVLIPDWSQGYATVVLSESNRVTRRTIHSLVAEAFSGPVPPGAEVCHNDGTRSNNSASNLRYDTPRGNAADRRRHGTHLEGEEHPSAILTALEVQEMRRLHRKGVGRESLASRFGTCSSNVGYIVNRQTWRHV